MIDALQNAASGLRSEQKQIDVISNNVANMQTPGFKRSRVNFVDITSLGAEAAGASAQQGHGNGTRVASVSTLFSDGEMKMTQNPLDIAIAGTGFFELEGPDGASLYTRDGQFRLDTEGYLTTAQGLRLANGFQIPQDATDLQVAGNGEVTARLGGERDRTVLGTLQLVAFAAPDALVSLGDNRYAATDAAGAPSYGQAGEIGFGTLQQGYVELANVEMIDEMTALVLAQRAYQLNARVLQASDQVLETINNLRR